MGEIYNLKISFIRPHISNTPAADAMEPEVYAKLGLGTFDKSLNQLLKYLASIDGYKKNRYEPYSPALKTRILSEFEPFIKKWEYDPNGSRQN